MRIAPFVATTVFCFSLVNAAPALAQRAPGPGMWAASGFLGVSAPSDASLDSGFDLAGNIEGYLTSRVSVRGQLGASWWDITGRNFDGTVNPVRLVGNLVYNWEGGRVHPYVTAGAGLYRYRTSITGSTTGSDSKAGFNLGGGIEYFVHRRTSIMGEALYHKVGAFNAPVTTFNSGSFWTIDAGLKAYFGR